MDALGLGEEERADEEPWSIFTRYGTNSRSDADRMLREHQNGNFLVHRVTLSPSDRERPEDLRDVTRYVLAEIEKEKGQRLHWFAVEHCNTTHLHVNVMIAVTGERESDGATKSVKLTREDYASMREDGREYCRMVNRVGERWEQPARDADREEERYALPPLALAADEEDEELKRRRRKHSLCSNREDHDR